MNSETLHGWIMAPQEARSELESMGIELGSFIEDSDSSYFEDCSVSDTAMEKLDSCWGRFYWALSDGFDEEAPSFRRQEYRS